MRDESQRSSKPGGIRRRRSTLAQPWHSRVLGLGYLTTLLFHAACEGESDRFSTHPDDDDTHAVDDDTTDDDDDVTGDDDIGDDDIGDDDSAGPNVVEFEDLGAEWECETDGMTPVDCIDDYLAFVEHPDVVPFADPISESEFDQLVDDVLNYQMPWHSDWPSGDPSRDVSEAMCIDFLLDGIDERLLVVTKIAEEVRYSPLGEPYLARQYIFEDELVGSFKVASLSPIDEPTVEAPAPAIIAFHGHGGDSSFYTDVYFFPELPLQGYVLFAPDLRADNVGESESTVTTTMLLNGFSFMAIRSYKGFLVQKYIDHLPGVDVSRIGLIGQSGGSVSLNATSRVRRYAAYISDHYAQYFGFENDNGNQYFVDETCFELHQLNGLINDFSTSWTPTLEVPYLYGYHGEEQVWVPLILEHLAEHLDPPGRRTHAELLDRMSRYSERPPPGE